MTLREVKEALDAEVIVGHDQLDLEVTKGGCSDMMSDVLVYCTSGSLLLTGLNNSQIVHTASIIDLAGIVMVSRKTPFSRNNSACRKAANPNPDNKVYPL